MNEHGISLKSGKFRGRLIRPTRFYNAKNSSERKFMYSSAKEKMWRGQYTNAIYSDDGGKTWHTSNPFPAKGTGEAAVVELSDGTIYYNSRRHFSTDGLNPRMRHIATSTDGGHSWEDLYVSEELPDGVQNSDYGLMAGMDRLPFEGRDILIFSNIESNNGRKNGTVWLSFDGGKSWPVKKLVEEEGFKYSSLAVGRKNTPSEGYIYLLYETGTKDNINAYGGGKIARFNLSWLMEGKDINQYLK
jgi:sialidase-1